MATGNGFLSITRDRSVSNAMRRFNLLVDDKTVDKIKSGETRRYALPSGIHEIRVGIDFYKSRPLQIDVQPGETIELCCGDTAPKTLGESLSLRGVGQSLKALTSPADYLYVRIAGRETPQIPVRDGPGERPAPQGRAPAGARVHAGPAIFLSYRREDSHAITGRICDRLTAHFGRDAVFRDVDSIPIGMDFRSKIRETIEHADLLIAIIGPDWLEARNPQGEARLQLSEDYVRLEIESALLKGIPVIPVLVEDAAMPHAAELPESIAQLAYRNALFIPREPFFHPGVDKLIEEIEGFGAKATPPKQRFCTGCGAPLKPAQQFCTRCGRQSARA